VWIVVLNRNEYELRPSPAEHLGRAARRSAVHAAYVAWGETRPFSGREQTIIGRTAGTEVAGAVSSTCHSTASWSVAAAPAASYAAAPCGTCAGRWARR
jgi:hypothetical protein